MSEPATAPPQADKPESAPLTSKDRKWWVTTGFSHLGLAAIPIMAAWHGIDDFLHPSANLRLTSAQQAAVNSGFHLGHDTTIHRVVVGLNAPSMLERVTAAAPNLMLAIMVLTLSRALWRIEVNMTAGPHQRPFTEKDQRVLTRVAWSMGVWWLAFIGVEIGGIFVARHLGVTGGWLGSLGDVTLGTWGLMLLMATFARVYRKGRDAYTDLEKIV